MTRCLLVDDDAALRTELSEYLQGFGFEVTAVASGVAMRQCLAAQPFAVVLLDVMLPGEDGVSLLRGLRQTSSTPVIMLTARGDTSSRVLGLELGADDYVAKPFEPRELVARIQAVLRRGSGGQDTGRRYVAFATWRFDRVARQLISAEDVVLPLSSAEFRLLEAFVSKAGQVLSRDRLLELTRAPGVEVNERSIDLAVSRLRTKLGDASREPGLIRTIRGEGYLFDTEVA